jgi:hypothetical protein
MSQSPRPQATQDDVEDDGFSRLPRRIEPIHPNSHLPPIRPAAVPIRKRSPAPAVYRSDPFTVPLIDVASSLTYAFSGSTVDPFANLVKLLNQKPGDQPSLFPELCQAVGQSSRPLALLSPLFDRIDPDSPPLVCRLALQSLTVLSINNPEFAGGVLERSAFLLALGGDFLTDVLALFEVVAEFATEEQAAVIVADFDERNLIKFPAPPKAAFSPIRAQVLAVCASLARFGGVFPEAMVDEIKKRCNFPPREIMWPAVVAVQRFLRQPGTAAYELLRRKKEELLGRLGLSVIACERKDDPELKIMVMKVFMEACDEFRAGEVPTSLTDLYFNLTAVLISMQHFDEEPVRRMAETLLRRFNFGN